MVGGMTILDKGCPRMRLLSTLNVYLDLRNRVYPVVRRQDRHNTTRHRVGVDDLGQVFLLTG